MHDGSGAGRLLVLDRPISFWGGVDPLTGEISDPRHPQHGTRLGDRLLVLERTIGSSSSSAIMLELLRNRVAPAGIIVGRTDAILVLGILVANHLGYETIPVLSVGQRGIARLRTANGMPATLHATHREGTLQVEPFREARTVPASGDRIRPCAPHRGPRPQNRPRDGSQEDAP